MEFVGDAMLIKPLPGFSATVTVGDAEKRDFAH
jgi:hypothetical protein